MDISRTVIMKPDLWGCSPSPETVCLFKAFKTSTIYERQYNVRRIYLCFQAMCQLRWQRSTLLYCRETPIPQRRSIY